MNEKSLIKLIKSTLNSSEYIGDDCAYLPELGIVVTQDSLVEGVHFLREKISPYELGFKSAIKYFADEDKKLNKNNKSIIRKYAKVVYCKGYKIERIITNVLKI